MPQLYADHPSFAEEEAFALRLAPRSMSRIAFFRQEGDDHLTRLSLPSFAPMDGITMADDNTMTVPAGLGTGRCDTDWKWPRVICDPRGMGWSTGVYVAVSYTAGSDLGNRIEGDRPIAPLHPDSDEMAVFGIRPTAVSSPIAYILPVATYQAYNYAGGGSFYGCAGKDWPSPSTVTYRRPGGGAGDSNIRVCQSPDFYDGTSWRHAFAHWDAHFLRWLASNGYRPDLYTDVDLDEGNMLVDSNGAAAYKLMLSVGHHEYWTRPMRDHVAAFLAAGGNLAVFSGNTCYREIVIDRGAGTITKPRRNPCTWPKNDEAALIGLTYAAGGGSWGDFKRGAWTRLQREPIGYTVAMDHWVFKAAGLKPGDTLGADGAIVGFECDGISRLTPAGTKVLATARLSGYWSDGARRKVQIIIHGDSPSGEQRGVLFNAGTTDWSRLLPTDRTVQAITGTVIEALTRGHRPLDRMAIRSPIPVTAAQGLERKRKEYEGMTADERARHFWRTRLEGETRIPRRQHPRCALAIVVAVYDERAERIVTQLSSLRNQRGIDPSTFEVIYVVNNGPPEPGVTPPRVIEANRIVLDMLRDAKEPFPVHVIDNSSAGNEIVGCNYGKARNRGLAEASLRFHENGRNGLLLQTDADTYCPSPDYLAMLLSLAEADADVIGIAGGLLVEYSPDSDDPKALEDLRKSVETLTLTIKWECLVTFLRNDPVPPFPDETDGLSGAHMISRSYESAAVGGFIEADSGGDLQFGWDLKAYAAEAGLKFIGRRWDLCLATALRKSGRTASRKNETGEIDFGGPLMGSDPMRLDSLSEFRAKVWEILKRAPTDATGLRDLLTDRSGRVMTSETALTRLVQHVAGHGVRPDDGFFFQWMTESFGSAFDLIQHLYDAQHPRTAITDEAYGRLVEKVMQKPGGPELMAGLDDRVMRFAPPHWWR